MKIYSREALSELQGTVLVSIVYVICAGFFLLASVYILDPFFGAIFKLHRGSVTRFVMTGFGVVMGTVYSYIGLRGLPQTVFDKYIHIKRWKDLITSVVAAVAGGIIWCGLHILVFWLFPSIRTVISAERFLIRISVIPGVLVILYALVTELLSVIAMRRVVHVDWILTQVRRVNWEKRFETLENNLLPGNVHSEKAFQLLKEGHYHEALAAAQQGCDIAGKKRIVAIQNYHKYGDALHNLALLHKKTGNYVEAETVFKKTIEVYEKNIGDDYPRLAVTLTELTSMYTEMGRYLDAIRVGNHALKTVSNAFGDRHPFLIVCLDRIATIYRDIGDYEKAVSTYLRVSDLILGIQSWIAQIAQQRNQSGAADLYLVGLGEDHRHLGVVLYNMAVMYLEMEEHEAATSILENASKILSNSIGEEHPEFAIIPRAFARLQVAAGNLADAQVLYQKAISIYQESSGESHPEFASTLTGLGDLYVSSGSLSDAERLYLEAIKVRRQALSHNHPEMARVLFNLAALYASTARGEEALSLMDEVVEIDDKTIGQVFAVASEKQRTQHLMLIRPRFDAYLSIVVQSFSSSPDAVRSAFSLVLRRKAIEAEAWAVQRDAVLQGKYKKLSKQFARLSKLKMQIAQLTLDGPGEDGVEAHRGILDELTSQKEKYEGELTQQIPEMNIDERIRAADRLAVASELPSGSVLVEFVRFDLLKLNRLRVDANGRSGTPRYLAFVLASREPNSVQMIDLGVADRIDQLIAKFRQSITGEIEDGRRRPVGDARFGRIKVSLDNAGFELRKGVFDPLMSSIGTRTRILIAPDGDLNRLPFEVLPLCNGKRLIDEYRVSYLGAGRDISRFKFDSGHAPGAPLVVADPDFDFGGTEVYSEESGLKSWPSRDASGRSLQFERLPGTRLEGERIGSILGTKPWLGKAALDGKLKGCKSPFILHLATHGFFREDQQQDRNEDNLGFSKLNNRLDPFRELGADRYENPLLRSGLALAGANTRFSDRQLPAEVEDGLLTAEDVSGMDLLETELVVLSACETGLGQIRIGEGVFGLRRAFLLAGAKTLLISLWKVPDEETQELMVDFYGRILSGQSRTDALREAQLTMKAKYPDPSCWGAFICQGNPGPLSRKP